MRSATSIVTEAIKNTRELEPEHWLRCLKQRAGTDPDHLGSFFPRRTAEQIDQIVDGLAWEPYTHPEVQEPAQAFIARSFPGRFGMVQLSDVPNDAELEWVPSKEGGKAELVWRNHNQKGIKVDFIVMLIGPRDGAGELVVWTFHPGDPIKPSTVDRFAETEGITLGMSLSRGQVDLCKGTHKRSSKATASAIGIKWVKLG